MPRMSQKDRLVMALDNLQPYLAIDMKDLETAFIEQPQRYYEVGCVYSEALSLRDTEKNAVKELYAKLSFQKRDEFKTAGERDTDSKIDAAIVDDETYRQCMATYLEVNELSERAFALKAAFEQRSYALNKLADMYVCGYVTSSSTESGRRSAIETKSARVQHKRRLVTKT